MSKKPEEPFTPKEDAETKVDMKVLDEAILKVLAYKPKKKNKATPSVSQAMDGEA